jgi:hypothetical protein
MSSTPTDPTGTLDTVARETGFSRDAVRAMADALADGGGAMAQFSHPEFGGSGQWMRGGMVMTGDFGDHGLKARIDRLCTMLAEQPIVRRAQMARGTQHQSQSTGPGVERQRGIWWPTDLGRPDVTGAQDDLRYAWFAQAQRLAIDSGGRVMVYDTDDHRIGGVSQQQGGASGLSFTSQHGPVALDRLRVVSGAAEPASRPSSQASPRTPSAETDPFAAIERLAELHARGVIDDDEFRAKKAELLARI